MIKYLWILFPLATLYVSAYVWDLLIYSPREQWYAFPFLVTLCIVITGSIVACINKISED